ncbi:MAG TPA: hypothetical protein VF299_02890 [Mycobacterium sp.]
MPGDIPLVHLERQTAAEPMLALPKLDGWAYGEPKESSLVRGMVFNEALRADEFTPNVVVTLENLTETVGTPRQAIDFEKTAITDNVGPLDTESPGTVCGYPSTTITYVLQGRPVSGLIVAARDSGDRVWAATVSMQTTRPDNPDYLSAKRTFFDGFQFGLPDPRTA